jgi:ATP-dependent RNA helicase RhlE
MSPKIRQLADEILRDPVMVTVDRQEPAAGIAQSAYSIAQERKTTLVSSLLRRADMRSVLIFVRRKIDADRLARAVTRGGVDATSIHADRTQEERVAALEGFRKGQFPVLIATDVAARGLDVNGISHVINFDVPHSADDYIHRAGRTARAGAVGEVITFVSPDEEERFGEIERIVGIVLPRGVAPGFESDARASASHGRTTRQAPDRSRTGPRGGRRRSRTSSAAQC